ncbi:MAG: hypothetical protein HC890_11245 [Chloroflexaceae bacterium]|nr:hypothetical protein [Chloroflexaceae bacterium]
MPLTPPTPSRPIQQVLAGLNPWLPSGFVILEPEVAVFSGQLASQKTAVVASELPSDFQVTIRGIATQLSNRRLMLVTANNQVLDLLCDEQIQQLEQRLAEAIATYWEQRIYLQTAATQGVLGNREASLAPVRFFWQTIDSVQRSPWMRKLNAFNESTLVDLLASRPWLTVAATKLVAVADRTLAQVESRVAQLRESVANPPAKPTAPTNETNPDN